MPESARIRNSRRASETQKTAYQKLIEETEGWEFAGIYADKARTGTKVKNRPGFQQMISDAERGSSTSSS